MVEAKRKNLTKKIKIQYLRNVLDVYEIVVKGKLKDRKIEFFYS